MDAQIISWAINFVATIVCGLVVYVYKNDKADSKEQSRRIDNKADLETLKDVEKQLKEELRLQRSENERLMEKLESRYEKEISTLEKRLSDQIKELKDAITHQTQILMDALKKD